MDLETVFRIDLGRLSHNEEEFTIEQIIAALEATTTLTDLIVLFYQYDPTPENNRRFIEPICRCISNLRLHNAHHPLRRLIFPEGNMDGNETRDVVGKFLVAAKHFGIFQIKFYSVYYVPVQLLVEFCRDNNSLKVLELSAVTISGEGAATSLLVNNGRPNNSDIVSLDELTLRGVSFEDSTAAAVFANLVEQVNVASLFLGGLTARDIDDEVGEDDGDFQITERILSEFKMPSVEQLTLYSGCRMELFKAVLEAGTTTVTDLVIHIWCDEHDEKARLGLLASFIRRAVKLNSLSLIRSHVGGPQGSPPPQFFQSLEACAMITEIRVTRSDALRPDLSPVESPDEVQQLQKITSRNRELDRFATNPGTYPTADLPELMCQFDNCPTGRYMLARRLVEVLSFAELCAMHLSRRQTNLPTPKKAKLQ